MADSIHTLALLQDEFPDPEQELYFQRLPTTTFHLFPKLPTELRIKIWRHTFPRTRCITIFDGGYRRGPFGSGPENNPCQHAAYVRFPVPPIAYCINRESRYEALKRYQYLNPQASRVTPEFDWVGIAGSSGGFMSREKEENILQSDSYKILRYPFFGHFFKRYFGDRSKDFFAAIGILELGVGSWYTWHFGPNVASFHLELVGLSLVRLIDDKWGRPRDRVEFSDQAAQECIARFVLSYEDEPALKVPEIVLLKKAIL